MWHGNGGDSIATVCGRYLKRHRINHSLFAEKRCFMNALFEDRHKYTTCSVREQFLMGCKYRDPAGWPSILCKFYDLEMTNEIQAIGSGFVEGFREFVACKRSRTAWYILPNRGTDQKKGNIIIARHLYTGSCGGRLPLTLVFELYCSSRFQCLWTWSFKRNKCCGVIIHVSRVLQIQ